MELPTICFVFPYIFIGIFIIIHIAIFLLILKFIQNVEKLAFLWGMINWTIAIGALYFGVDYFLQFESESLLMTFIAAIIPLITEDIGRFIVFTFIYKSKDHNFNNSLIFGAGHGGWESIFIMVISYIPLLLNFYEIKNAKDEKELIEKELIKTYDHYKNGISGQDIFDVISRFLGNLFHMGASVIIYRFSLNPKDKKYIIFFIVLLIAHYCIDFTSQLIFLYELNMWFNLIYMGLAILITVIGIFVWKENNNKEYNDYIFEGKNGKIEEMFKMDDMNYDKIS